MRSMSAGGGGAAAPLSNAGSLKIAALSFSSPTHCPISAAPATSAAIIDLVAATERSGPACSGSRHFAARAAGGSPALARGGGGGRINIVDKGERQGAGAIGGVLQGDNVGTAARLRDGDRQRALEPQRRIIERGDRRADRGAGHAERDLDEIFQIERGMIRAAARDGGDQARIALGDQR